MNRFPTIPVLLLGFALFGCTDKDNGTCSAPDDNVQWFWIYENGGPLLGTSEKCLYCDNSIPPEEWDAYASENGFFYPGGGLSPGGGTPCFYSGSSDIHSADACGAAMCGDDPPTHDVVGPNHGAWRYIEPLLGGAAGGAPSDDGFEPMEESSDEPLGCAPVAPLSCGGTINGDTSDPTYGTTQNVDRYEGAVGNYGAPEVAYTFTAPVSGPVSFAFVDPDPTGVDLDLFLLHGPAGCQGEAAVQRGFNSLDFEATEGETYTLVVDGFAGAQGAFSATLDCGDTEAPPADAPAEAPDPSIYGSCLFGWQSQHIEAASHLETDVLGQYTTPGSVPSLTAQQAVEGIKADGWASVANIQDVFTYVDSDGIYVNDVVYSASGADYTWLQWYSGDTEVGYLYQAGTLNLVATVSDGDIYDCTAQL